MGLLDSFEKGLERAVNGAFAKTFRSGVQPVEIASALRSELDKKAAVVSRDRTLVPNTFTVLLAPDDHARITGLGPALDDELIQVINKHAKAQRYSFAGTVTVTIEADSRVSTGTVRVNSSTAQGRVSWRAVVDVEGKRHVLTAARTVIGRGTDADITISDSGTSRKHVEILWDGKRAMVRDLGSTNGTSLNGSKVIQAALAPESTVTIGRTRIVFRVIPQASEPAADPTRAYQQSDGGRR